MRTLLDRRSLLGAFVGAGAALLGVWLAGSQPEHLPYTVLLVIAIAIVGFAVGYLAAAWAYGVGLLIVLMAVAAEEVWAVSDIVRFIAFLFGSPVIVYLARRAEDHRTIAARALATSHDARRQADEERERLERASRELDTALGAAERERARLEEVAEAIPEPLIVYDDRLRGTYGNRAALRLFGRSFVERPLDEWGRMTEPRDEGERRSTATSGRRCGPSARRSGDGSRCASPCREGT